MTLEEVLDVIFEAEKEGLTTVRLHTGGSFPIWSYPGTDGCVGRKKYSF